MLSRSLCVRLVRSRTPNLGDLLVLTVSPFYHSLDIEVLTQHRLDSRLNGLHSEWLFLQFL